MLECDVLEAEGHEVPIAPDAAKAIEAFKSGEFELLIIEIFGRSDIHLAKPVDVGTLIQTVNSLLSHQVG